jgi:hypothetical protein
VLSVAANFERGERGKLLGSPVMVAVAIAGMGVTFVLFVSALHGVVAGSAGQSRAPCSRGPRGLLPQARPGSGATADRLTVVVLDSGDLMVACHRQRRRCGDRRGAVRLDVVRTLCGERRRHTRWTHVELR